jgi:hypothetical protein
MIFFTVLINSIYLYNILNNIKIISFEKIFIYLFVIIILQLKKNWKMFPKKFPQEKKIGVERETIRAGWVDFQPFSSVRSIQCFFFWSNQFNVLEAPTCPFLKKQMFEKKDDLVRA